MRFSTTRHSRASSSLMYSSRQIRCGDPAVATGGLRGLRLESPKSPKVRGGN